MAGIYVQTLKSGNGASGVKRDLIWDSGVTGLNVILPDDSKITKSVVLDVMSDTLSVTE
jgi:hypothetical protein